jgi:hypothetical protein
MGPPYKDVMGRWRTHSLFRESYQPQDEGLEAVFTLGEEDIEYEGRILPSMRKLFLSYNDPTGYQFAKEVLGSYEHWKRLCKASWFQAHLSTWLEELEVKLMSSSIRKIKDVAGTDTAQAFNAAKYLAERGWVPKKGRPSKDAIQREARIQAQVEEAVEEDAQRLQLVKG